MTFPEACTVILSTLAGTGPLGYMVGRLQIRVRELERERAQMWIAIKNRPTRYELYERTAAPVRATVHDINPSERQEA